MCNNTINTKQNSIKCSLCGNQIETNMIGWNLGNNPHPLMKRDNDRCCDDCNTIYVIPIRKLMEGLKNNPMYHKMVNKKGWLKNIKGSMDLVRFSFVSI